MKAILFGNFWGWFPSIKPWFQGSGEQWGRDQIHPEKWLKFTDVYLQLPHWKRSQNTIYTGSLLLHDPWSRIRLHMAHVFVPRVPPKTPVWTACFKDKRKMVHVHLNRWDLIPECPKFTLSHFTIAKEMRPLSMIYDYFTHLTLSLSSLQTVSH